MNAPANTRADRIVVVDDDARIRDLLRRYLSQEGFDVLLAEDAKALNRVLTRETVDLIVLDLMLPGEDGLSICRRLRAANDQTPIIMLTAKVEDVDRIVGLEVGADDYLPKPFNPRELLARIHAVLRRGAAGAHHEPDRMVLGDLELDTIRRRAFRAGTRLDLTAQEYTLLSVLLRHRGEVMSRTVLTELVWDMNFDGDSNVVEVAIRRLRSKLDEPFPTKLLHTVRGMGYVLELDRGNDADA